MTTPAQHMRKRRNRQRRAEAKGRRTRSDWPSRSLKGRRRPTYLLQVDHSAVMECRTKYPSTVLRVISNNTPVLKPGNYQRKMGAVILKGDWKGFPVYTLTLEERRTCPNSCHHWRSCYGNNMQWAHRMPHGAELERRLEIEVADHAKNHPEGFAVRLHVLGDFYSLEYVALWRQLLERHRPLHVWGYTARIDADDPIAAALVTLSQQDKWDRFRMRFSNAPLSLGVPTTISIEHPYQVPPDATVCPEQVGRTESCSTCALCWHSKERIAFIQH